MDRNDAALEKYAGYSAEQFPEPWKSDYVKLMEQIEEYRNNGQEKGLFVSIERVMVDHYVKGMGVDIEGTAVTLDYDMIRAGAEAGQGIVDWLEGYGMTTSPLMEYVYTPGGRGMGLINLLAKAAEGAEIRLSTRATDLIVENGKVVGVIAVDGSGNEITFRANGGVVLATGSFSSNGEMIARYQKVGTGLTANMPSNNPAGNRGDGIVMAEKVGEHLRDMGFMQSYLKGYQNLAASVATFNGYVDAGTDADFGRAKFNGKVENGPCYICKLQLAAHLTFGGLVIDAQSQVLDVNGAAIPGLYAAGDVTSGYEGVVHQTGNCLTICINTGRIAGEEAAKLAK